MSSYAVDETPFPSRVAFEMKPHENQCCVVTRRGRENKKNKKQTFLCMHAASKMEKFSDLVVWAARGVCLCETSPF